MITKYKQFNESSLDKLTGPSKEEIWKNFGYDKTFDTPKEFFLDVIDGLKIKEESKYSDHIFWEKDGNILFEQDLKSKYLWVEYYHIWIVFENIFDMKYYDIQSFINNMVEEYLNWKGFTSNEFNNDKLFMVEEHNWKGLNKK
jgi:hypothetical protein